MQKNILSVYFISMAMLCIAMPVFAESAPVYDVDSIQEQFDSANNDQPQPRDVPPPAPGQEAAAFVPAQTTVSTPSVSVMTPPSPNMSIEKRVKRIEQQLLSTQGQESVARIESLQEQVQTLRGQLEQVTHQLQQMQEQQKTMYADLDSRLVDATSKANKKNLSPGMSAASAADPATKSTPVTTKPTKSATTATVASSAAAAITAPVPADAPKTASGQPNVAEEQQIYQTAYNLIKAKKYNEAVAALQGMLKKYPSGQFASNAHYWLGELYGLMNKNDDALTEFTVVLSKYPDSPRISDAQLKVGLIYAAESNWAEAKTAFKKVINHYPGTASARVASEQLKAIKQAGN